VAPTVRDKKLLNSFEFGLLDLANVHPTANDLVERPATMTMPQPDAARVEFRANLLLAGASVIRPSDT